MDLIPQASILFVLPFVTDVVVQMKPLLVVLLFFLVSCAARPPLEELVAEAEVTGDWSAVERYKRMNKSMNRIDGEEECANGFTLLCRTKSQQSECACVKQDKYSIFND